MPQPIARTTRSLLAAVALVLAGACKGENKPRPAAPDTTAAREVDSTQVLAYLAAIDQSEVQAAQIGARRASDSEVHRFAQLLWREHAQSGRDLAQLARQLEIDLRSVPATPMMSNLQAMSQQTTQLLNRTPKSPAFDRAYIDSQVRAHQAALQDLRRILSDSGRVSASLAPGGGVDVGIIPGRSDTSAATAAAAKRAANRKAETPREAAQMMLAQVQQHLDRARQLQSKLGGAGPSR